MSTKIEWVRNADKSQGRTWNPITGCSAVSAGCRNCYARRMARRLAGRHGYPEYPHHFDVTLRPDRLDIPLRRKKPTTYFVCSMSDLFHEDVPYDFIHDVFVTMWNARQHTFQVLTKRPQRMYNVVRSFLASVGAEMGANSGIKFAALSAPNIWLGVSCENQATADERIPLLLQTPAAVRFVSCEPLLGPIRLDSYKWLSFDYYRDASVIAQRGIQRESVKPARIDWVICGGESGPGARPMHPDWARLLVQQCKTAGVPIFVKQMGTVWAKKYTVKGDAKGHSIESWPKDLRVRQWPQVHNSS